MTVIQRRWFLAIGMSLALGLTGLLLAHGHHGHHGRSEQPGADAAWPRELMLTVEQSRKLVDLTRSFQVRTEPLWAEFRRHQETLERTWSSEAPSERQLDSALDDLQRVRARLHECGRTYLIQVRVLLTADQACRCVPSGCPCAWACGRCTGCGQPLSCCGDSAPCGCASHDRCRRHCR